MDKIFHLKYCILLFFLVWVSSNVNSQNDTISIRDSLPDIVIWEEYRKPLNQGIGIQYNAQYELSNQQKSVSNVLAENTNSYVKNYGPAGLSTVSSPGSSAAQTVISFEGLDIRNNTLGLTDLSLYPSFLFSTISVQNNLSNSNNRYSNDGRQVSAIGDHINFGLETSNNTNAEVLLQIGSFGQKEAGISLSNKSGKYAQITKLYGKSNINNFNYINIDQEKVPLSNAQLKGLSGVTKHVYKLNRRNNVRFTGLFSSYDRQIPPTRFQAISSAYQSDRAIKLLANHTYSNARMHLSSMLSLSDDQVRYHNPAIRLFSKNQGTSWQLNSTLNYQLSQSFQVQSGFRAAKSFGRSDAYVNNAIRKELEGYLAGNWQVENWHFYLRNSIGITNLTKPFHLPAFKISYQQNSRFTIKGSINRIYRIPSLDDLFWQPGGNPSLTPENGWEQNLLTKLESQNKGHALILSIFNKNVQDWIIWSPNELNIWQPENVSTVRSQGGYVNYQWTKTIKKASIHLNVGYNYTSVLDKNTDENFISRRNKQLIYSPKHQVKLNTSIFYKKFRLNLHQRWVSTTFADPLNKIKLPAYFLGNASIFRALKFGETEFEIGFFANNIWNTEYEIVKNYPLPGRNFLLQLNFRLNKKE